MRAASSGVADWRMRPADSVIAAIARTTSIRSAATITCQRRSDDLTSRPTLRVSEGAEATTGFSLAYVGSEYSHARVLLQRPLGFLRCVLQSPSSILVLLKAALTKTSRPPDMDCGAEWLYVVTLPGADRSDLALLLFDDLKANLHSRDVPEFCGMLPAKNVFSRRYQERLGAEFLSAFSIDGQPWIGYKHSTAGAHTAVGTPESS